uniref:Integrin_alpha2 domain-containing protein n=2 Tax=Mesocestoides corti TaxID=53468 RepID=A0A5K3ESL4_MESCO
MRVGGAMAVVACMLALFLCFVQFASSSSPSLTLSSWFPQSSTVPLDSSQYFRLVSFPSLQERFLAEFVERLESSSSNVRSLEASHFQWTGVTMFREGRTGKSWLIVAGASPKRTRSGNAFRNDFSAVLGCEVSAMEDGSGGFDISVCELLGLDTGSPTLNHTDGGLLGKGLQSLQLPTGGGVVVICDPLWHKDQGTLSPGGKCDVLHRRNNVWRAPGPIEFCTSAGHTQPCAGGFSIDLRLTEDGSNAQLLAGLPFAQPNRRVRTVDDLLRRGQQHIRDIESEEECFGAAVAWSPHLPSRSNALAIVGSPSENVYGFPVNSLVEDIDAAVLNLRGDTFGGMGFALETSLVNGSLIVFAGAPYEDVEKYGANTGKVYVQYRSMEGTRNYSLSGNRPGEMFGYAIARIGDVDGDAVADLAISAPSLGDEKTTGRVYIFRVSPDFPFESRPFQILEAPENVTGFGVSLSRGVDLDSDGGPELAVTTLDPKTPVLVYSPPRRLRAKCTIKANPKVTPTSVRTGDVVTLKFTINLIDSISNKKFPASPNFQTRHHQVNPDVLWLERYKHLISNQNQSDFDLILAEFFGAKQSSNLVPS